MQQPVCTQSVVVKHEQGLHARPAEMLARAAMGFDSQVELVFEERRIDAKSILNILTLGAVVGSSIEVHAAGDDAQQAVETLATLLESDFDGEAPTTPSQDRAPESGALGQQA